MANNLSFYPLYWIWHDTWMWKYLKGIGPFQLPTEYWYYHQGHCHFWFMGFSALDSKQQAYKGTQLFNFKLHDLWSPNSSDKNFQGNIRIIGRPMWYFKITEYWRRIYIQEWDYATNSKYNKNILGKRGIKYDACLNIHKNGPFRETRDNFVMFHQMPRTLPIEYWRNEEKTIRDHYLRKEWEESLYNSRINVNLQRQKFFNFGLSENDPNNDYNENNRDYWMIPKGEIAGPHYPTTGTGDPREDMARRTAYPDYYYIYPTLEYQTVIQLDWERLYGWQNRDVEDWKTGENFGDFYETSIVLPYTKKGIVQSPFSDSSGMVSPAGEYHNNVVPLDKMLKYKSSNQVSNMQREFLHPDKEGEYVKFHSANHIIDGKWVEQFLGGIILAKAVVVVEDLYGKREQKWVHGTQFFIADAFEGVDQNAAPA